MPLWHPGSYVVPLQIFIAEGLVDESQGVDTINYHDEGGIHGVLTKNELY